MTALAAMLVIVAAIALAIPTLTIAVEIAASFAPARRRSARAGPASVAALIPAHNEAAMIEDTVRALIAALAPIEKARVLVVADNCRDETAARARALGAEVIERHDAENRGKGFALQFGVDHLRADPPDAVLFVDADAELVAGEASRLIALAIAEQRPAQAIYRMRKDAHANAIASFAWAFMNEGRMRGLDRLAGACRYLGVGMAAPWTLVERVDWASAALTEDHELTLKFAQLRAAPFLAPDVVFESAFAPSERGAAAQRARWEQGSIGVAARLAPRAIAAGAARRDARLLALGLDAMAPPIALLCAALLAFGALALICAPLLGWAPLIAAGFLLATLAGAILIAWPRYARGVSLSRVGADLRRFALQKLSIYGEEGARARQGWTRADRGAPSEGSDP